VKAENYSDVNLIWQMKRKKAPNECFFEGCERKITDKENECCTFHSLFIQRARDKLIPAVGELSRENKIYFVLAEEVGRIKIGKSLEIENRVSQLQTGSPIELKLVCLLDLSDKYEGILHEFFKEDRVHGEWFEYSEDIKAFIELAERKGSLGVIQFFQKYCEADVDES